jgi:hypothetical protein
VQAQQTPFSSKVMPGRVSGITQRVQYFISLKASLFYEKSN